MVAVDTLAHCCGVGPDAIRALRRKYLGAHGSPRMPARPEADLAAAGWRVLRFDAHVVMSRPGEVVAEVEAVLAARSDS